MRAASLSMSLTAMVGNWPWILTGALTGFLAYCNRPLYWMSSPQRATTDWLSSAPLKRLDSSEKVIGAELWRERGAVVMAEAKALSSLKEHFEAKRVPMYALLHEELGAAGFSKFFEGELLLDEEKRFYGPEERRMLLTGMLRLSVWQNLRRASSKGVEGNLKGDGSLLGSVFLLGPGGQGILYEHREREFGDHYNTTELLDALSKVPTPSD
ncbi:Redox-regulatory protein FAM213A [Chionoecetes opilio]|uniref:Peroxiredoxin-like 2A n=1 Tax=Chionoecetes opilio TaxID=41210 RepID=A0A8J4YIH6_CHIOP|nr:Redox-regulatory protein FAM213A [Chionoecetes opilio]